MSLVNSFLAANVITAYKDGEPDAARFDKYTAQLKKTLVKPPKTEILLIPVHVPKLEHWFLCVWNPKDSLSRFYDSYVNESKPQEFCQAIGAFLMYSKHGISTSPMSYEKEISTL